MVPSLAARELGRYLGRVAEAYEIVTLHNTEARDPQDEATSRIHKMVRVRIRRLARNN